MAAGGRDMPSRLRWVLIVVVAFLASGCHATGTTTVAVDPSGERLYVAGGSDSMTLRVVDVKTRVIVDRIPLTANGYRIAVNQSNGQVYVAGTESISLVDTTSSRVVSTISIGAPISGMAVDAPGAQLIVLLEDRNRILFVDTSAFQIVRMVDLGLPNGVMASFVTVMPGAGVVYILEFAEESDGNSRQTTLSPRDLRIMSVIAWRQLGDLIPTGLAVHPSGTRVYIAGVTGKGDSIHGRFLALETGSHRVVANLPIKGFPGPVAISPSGALVYLADYFAGTLTVITSASNSVVSSVAVGKEPLDVVVNPVTGELYVPLDDGTIAVVNASENRVVTSIRP